MKTNKGILAAILLAVSFSVPSVRAEQDGNQELRDFFQEEIHRFGSDQCALEGESDWPIKRIFFGVEPYVTFGIGSVLSLTVAPQIVFVWEKVDHDEDVHRD